MEKFLYVFSESARDKLLSANYTLLKSDDKNEIYVFVNKADIAFAVTDVLADTSFISSDTLTF